MACSYSPGDAAPQSAYAPALIAAYALGATLWAPVLALFGESLVGLLAFFLGTLPLLDSAELFAIAWVGRFTLYVLGARGGWNYGYGISGVIVNRRLTLPEKLYRITTDWFGIVLIVILVWFTWGVVEAALVAG